MGILPLQYADGATRESLGLTGEETFAIEGVAAKLEPGMTVKVTATAANGDDDDVRRARPHRHARRSRILPPRRHPAVRAASARRGVTGAVLVRNTYDRGSSAAIAS